jgi:hypothetical protein
VFLDWIGSLRIRHRSPHRVELCLTRSTAIAGWTIALIAAGTAAVAAPISMFLASVPGVIALFGLVLGTLRRTLVFDRDDGLLRVEQQLAGITTRAAIPLFHLRAVVLAARIAPDRASLGPRFVAYLDRRVGPAIHLDESRRAAQLKPLVEAIAEVAELRLVYDISARAVGNQSS